MSGPASNPPSAAFPDADQIPGQPPRPAPESAPASTSVQPQQTAGKFSASRRHRFHPSPSGEAASYDAAGTHIGSPPPPITPRANRTPSTGFVDQPRPGPAALPTQLRCTPWCRRRPTRARHTLTPLSPHRSPPRQPNARAHPDQHATLAKHPGPPSTPVGRPSTDRTSVTHEKKQTARSEAPATTPPPPTIIHHHRI